MTDLGFPAPFTFDHLYGAYYNGDNPTYNPGADNVTYASGGSCHLCSTTPVPYEVGGVDLTDPDGGSATASDSFYEIPGYDGLVSTHEASDVGDIFWTGRHFLTMPDYEFLHIPIDELASHTEEDVSDWGLNFGIYGYFHPDVHNGVAGRGYIDLKGSKTVSFWLYHDSEFEFDYFYVKVNCTGGSKYEYFDVPVSDKGEWVEHSMSIPENLGSIYRFDLGAGLTDTNNPVNIYIDLIKGKDGQKEVLIEDFNKIHKASGEGTGYDDMILTHYKRDAYNGAWYVAWDTFLGEDADRHATSIEISREEKLPASRDSASSITTRRLA